jgi:hypothetical protein
VRFHDLPWFGRDSRLMLGAEVTYDDVRDTQAFGLIQLRIPFGAVAKGKHGPVLNRLERRMVDPIVRDVDVVSGTGRGAPIPAINPHTGEVFRGVVQVNAASQVVSEVERAGENALVIVDGSLGPIVSAQTIAM